MSQLEQARKAGLLFEEKPEVKKTGLEIARDALARSHPNSPAFAYLDKMILKAQTLNRASVEASNINQERETNMEETTTAPVETPSEQPVGDSSEQSNQ